MRDLIFGWENADVLVAKWVACCGCLDGDCYPGLRVRFPSYVGFLKR